jgi:hypothetical protein
MRDWRAKLACLVKEGDDNLVTLFQVGGVVALVAVAVLAAPRHGDAMLRYVPRSAVAYVHAEGPGLARLGAFLPSTLAETRPSEVGAFAMTDTASGQLAWFWLLRWSDGRRAAGVNCETAPKDDFCLVVANQHLRDKAMAALRNDTASIAFDQRVTGSLAAVRGMSLIQAYVQPDGFRGLASEGVGTPGAVVMTWQKSGVTAVWPVGEQVRAAVSNAKATGLAAGDALTVVGSNEATKLAVTQLILGERAKTADRPMVAQLESMFVRASYLAVREGGQDYMVWLKGVSKKRLAENLAAYFSSIVPIERPITLPDGQSAVEIAVDASGISFKANQSGNLLLTSSGVAVPALALREDGHGGVWVLGGERTNLTVLPNQTAVGRSVCFKSSADPDSNPLDGVLLGSKSTCVVEYVDKSVVIYRDFPQQSVDK